MSPKGRPRALCILGMHRSGTSAVTRAFNLLGAHVGEQPDLLPESPTNHEGYWERADICSFHDRLLAVLRLRWDTALPLPDGWHRSPEVAPYREELKKIIGTAFAGHTLWAWKDPRTCMLLELWKEILDELGTDLVAVVVVRHPRDVAASLGRRNGFGLEKSTGIWFNYTLAALRSVQNVRTAFIGYDRFLENPVGGVQMCAEALGITLPDDTDEAFAAIRRSVRKDLRHSQATEDALEALPGPARELYLMTRQATVEPASRDSAFFARIEQFHQVYLAYAGFFREDLEHCEPRVQPWARMLAQSVTLRIWRITGPARRATAYVRGKVRPPDLPE